ncbi:MAG: aminoglycoside 3-N-acetyltransferase [Thermoanaerobacteraceae bacterium]|jgi:aminoglycoside 3-N-acetyltransferase|nr:aminoglycoside 3-N-acetyltransferase [Thermoanaerobacteraceae bacterium]MDN5313051.1 aminoglycoside 3-N-acetyltransferase [Thermoanaerobacteraceae bacterium]RKL61530.1 aminoglycoside N(3)-acetyltransferase [Thermoanaerobacteraceae bacterium SP2]
MSEAEVINKTLQLNTRQSIAEDLYKLGVDRGATVLVHSSLSALGWVCGGPVAVIQALMDVVTGEGTIMMPTHSGDYSDPGNWGNPPVPEEWWPVIKETMPAYEPEITPTRGMGKIPETFRNFPGVIRSSHPLLSFAAWGKNAKQLASNHSLNNALGENSPLARLYDLDGWVLLLGVGYDSNTSFHLAEYRAPGSKPFRGGAPVIENGQRVWKSYNDIEFDTDVFPQIGSGFEKQRSVRKGKVGLAPSRYFKQREAVDFAVEWLTKMRKA